MQQMYIASPALRAAVKHAPIAMTRLAGVVGLRSEQLSRALAAERPFGETVAARLVAVAALVGVDPETALVEVEGER